MSNDLPNRPTYTYTEEDWNQLRAHFMGSILVEIHLHKLAQNIGASWPSKRPDETPAKYLEYSFEELTEAPGLAGHPNRLQLLLDILKETASFDDPFQDMVDSTSSAAKPACNSDQLLQKLAIPPDFPIAFTALSSDTRALCHAEGAVTIGQCVALFQRMAQNVILGGEIRQLLNCLAHTDERGLAAFLPLRPGARGLHLAEAIGITIRNLPEHERIACLLATPTNKDSLCAAEERLVRELPALLEWFPDESAKLGEIALSGEEATDRYFHSLSDPSLEQAAARIARRYFLPETPTKHEDKPSGFIRRVTGFFRST